MPVVTETLVCCWGVTLATGMLLLLLLLFTPDLDPELGSCIVLAPGPDPPVIWTGVTIFMLPAGTVILVVLGGPTAACTMGT